MEHQILGETLPGSGTVVVVGALHNKYRPYLMNLKCKSKYLGEDSRQLLLKFAYHFQVSK